ncbi:hypothetical protein TanjilG_16103 [Lupinus angustifolius]|uniref:Uncharacterized protein n=1 Tax=Lupinus angustifolius TaxID=3871 RepID=A0A394DBT5_LUPAN|nr:hypothetical protein TanjilG_16103 [Lupinus angustifolius]
MEYGVGDGGGSSGNHHHHHHDGGSSDSQRRKKKRYHRHTANQIQRLESMFKECPHPDEKQRMQLSRELGLAPRQIKFWFQNRRTQIKAQHERADNCTLRAENDRIRCENIAYKEALKNMFCPSCGGPPLHEDPYVDEQKLRMDNAQLKEELERVSSIAAKYIGRPISQLPSIQPIHMSSLDLSMGSFVTQGLSVGPSLDLDLLPGNGTSSSMQNVPYQPTLSDMDNSLMSDIASNAMEELIRLLQTNEPLWMKSSTDGRDVLNIDTYERMFPKPNSHSKNPNVRIEASRDSGVVIMNGLTLVDMFMDPNKWMELFPTIVTMARTFEVLSSGIIGGHSGTLQLMYEEMQVLSPLVSTREFYFLRYCQQIEQGLWAIVDVSYDFPQDNQFVPQFRSHRLPSGCFIQDMPNGYSQVTWVEHVEVEDKTPVHRLYRNLLYSGLAFGAHRWLSNLQRMCERIACLMVSGNSTRDLGSVIPSAEGKRSMMKLAQRMITNFSASISTSCSNRWTTLSGLNEIGVRVIVHNSSHPGQPNGVVLSAATTIWLPIPPQIVFNFFKDERKRPQNKWMELFPTIVTMARTFEVLSSGIIGGHSGTLQLMYEEMQVLSPLVSTREFYFLRYCQQIEQGLWAIVDVSYDFPQDNQFVPQFRSHRLPSGCFIQDMPNGYSQVTWVEHVEVEDKTPVHRLYRNLLYSGLAFGAHRWLSNLQRMCERIACLMVSGNSTRDLGSVIPSAEGKRSMMKLAQRMITNFSASISTSCSNRWTTLSGLNEIGVRVIVHNSSHPGQPNGVVLSAATTIWLPIPPQIVFNFFKDERKRPQWDVLSNGNAVQEVAHIANGSNPGNCISVLRAFNTSQNSMLILQESCIDSSGSLVVYCPVELSAINIAMSGEDPSYIPLLPSGFTIAPDGQTDQGHGDGASTSTNKNSSGGSLVTVAFQILVSSLPSSKLNKESVNTINNLIGTTVQQIKAALNCHSS